MSYTLKLTADGDLDLSTTVEGLDKLKQDLSIWLREEYGVDRFHPNYGSVLQNFIGENIDELTLHLVEVEVIRVFSGFQQAQLNLIKQNPGKYSMDELLDRIITVNVKLDYDTVYADVTFVTAAGNIGALTESVTL